MQIIKGIKRRPRKVLLYGTHGIGKSTWAAGAPNAYLICTEDGANDIGCDRSPVCRSLGEVNATISDLLTQQHGYNSLAIDTLDWLEKLVFAQVCQDHGKKSIEDIGYAKGYTFALNHWDFLLKSLDHLASARKMGIILLAHSRIVKIEEPELDSYNKYEPDLDKRSCGMLQEWCDEVFFARYKVMTVKSDEGFNRERTRVVGETSDRIVYTCEGPGFFAKRRIPMPDQIPLDFRAYMHFIKQAYGGANATAPVANAVVSPAVVQADQAMARNDISASIAPDGIAGVMTNGHSQSTAPEWATT